MVVDYFRIYNDLLSARKTSVNVMRNSVFDMMKGLAILLMILGHCRINSDLHHAIYLFHIPMFFIVSGYFFKRRPVVYYALLDLKRLILPYIIFSILVLLKFIIDAFRLHNFTTVREFLINIATGNFGIGPIWFLLALFWCRQLFNEMSNANRKTYCLIAVSVFIGVCKLNFENTLSFFVGVSAVVFYAFGALWAKKQWVLNLPITILCLALSVTVFFLCDEMDVHTMTYPIYPLNILGACSATLFLYSLFDSLKKIVVFEKVLGFYGRWSLLLLGVHYTEFMLFDWYGKISNGTAVAVLRVALDALIVWGLSRFSVIKKTSS